MKNSILLIIIVAILIIILGGGYVYFTATSTVEVDEPSPLGINDAMLTMDDATKAEFEAAVEEASQNVMEMSDSMPSQAEIIAQGNFKERAHSVKGKALLIEQNGNKILRFENFETGNGPNLHIYLSSALGNDDFIDLGKIKATKGNVNYEIPSGVDTDKYDKVLVWCVPFRVLFSYAELK